MWWILTPNTTEKSGMCTYMRVRKQEIENVPILGIFPTWTLVHTEWLIFCNSISMNLCLKASATSLSISRTSFSSKQKYNFQNTQIKPSGLFSH